MIQSRFFFADLGGPPNPDDIESGITIGGTASGDGNLISGNQVGIRDSALHDGEQVSAFLIVGNFIGTNPNGSQPLANSVGVLIDTQASGATIGGAIAGNIISGNTESGIDLNGGWWDR